jgi:membrane protein DedA with SNARE-associated domain
MQQDKSLTGYWYSFCIGAAIGCAGMYLLGTKHGRKSLHVLTSTFENIEEKIEEYLDNNLQKEE